MLELRSLFPLFRLAFAALVLFAARPAMAGPDSWTLSLVWSPEYCNSNLSSKEPQCVEERFFTVNGFEPVFTDRKPPCSEDRLEEVDIVRWFAVIPNRARIASVWRRQGACSELPKQEYFVQMERASRRIVVPQQYSGVLEQIDTSTEEVKKAFLIDNPELNAYSLAFRCQGRWLKEVEACFTPDLKIRNCGLPENCPEKIRLRPLRRSREGQEPVYR